jgi:hypothetical protein
LTLSCTSLLELLLKTNPKGKYDLKLYCYQYSTEKRDMMVDIIDNVMINM